jgi:hypothetical protein
MKRFYIYVLMNCYRAGRLVKSYNGISQGIELALPDYIQYCNCKVCYI